MDVQKYVTNVHVCLFYCIFSPRDRSLIRNCGWKGDNSVDKIYFMSHVQSHMNHNTELCSEFGAEATVKVAQPSLISKPTVYYHIFALSHIEPLGHACVLH